MKGPNEPTIDDLIRVVRLIQDVAENSAAPQHVLQDIASEASEMAFELEKRAATTEQIVDLQTKEAAGPSERT